MVGWLWVALCAVTGSGGMAHEVTGTSVDAGGVWTYMVNTPEHGDTAVRVYCPVRGVDPRRARMLLLLTAASDRTAAGDAVDEVVRLGAAERARVLVVGVEWAGKDPDRAARAADFAARVAVPLAAGQHRLGRVRVTAIGRGAAAWAALALGSRRRSLVGGTLAGVIAVAPSRAEGVAVAGPPPPSRGSGGATVEVWSDVGGPGARQPARGTARDAAAGPYDTWRGPWVAVALEKLMPAAPARAGRTSPNLRYYERPRRPVVEREVGVDACVYGSTAAAAMAAIQLRRSGYTVALVCDAMRLAGLTTGGLSWTDVGNKGAIGGIAREFYRRVGAEYGVEEEWCFEPRVAERVLHAMVAEAGVPVHYRQFLARVNCEAGKIASIRTEDGLTVHARVFIDATYEGDLMARAGVTYHVGREANREHGETLNGVQVRDKHQFGAPVDPYVNEGDATSGLLPGIDPSPEEPAGTGDGRVQAYNFRLCLTKAPANRVPFAKPPRYCASDYTLLGRYLRTAEGRSEVFGKFDPLRGAKVDKNNHGAFSTDYIGMNHGYPDAGYAGRERIFQAHVRYQQGLFWYLCDDAAVPDGVRSRMAEWGLCRDEFVDTGGWSPQLYVREARRMAADYVMTEHDCRGTGRAPDAVGLGSYGMDSHNCRRLVRDGRVLNEGDVQVGGFTPYPVSYRAIVPRKAECTNLLVPVCVSSTHIAYGSVRMEPVFMILAQSAAIAACLALDAGCAVQDVPYARLRGELLSENQVLAWPPHRP